MSEKEEQLQQESDVWFIDRKEFYCRRHQKRNFCGFSHRIHHKCLECADYNLCESCITNSTLLHPNHPFRKIDLRSLMQPQGSVPFETPSNRLMRVSKHCCLTCLDHRPADFPPTDSPSGDQDRERGPSFWMSTIPIWMSDLRVSAAEGCKLCSIIYRGVQSAYPIMAVDDHQMQMVVERDHIRVADLQRTRPTRNMWTFYFFAGPDVRSPWHTLGQSRKFPTHYDSDACFQKIQSWIKECEKQHSNRECRRETSQVLPQRVIRIRGDTEGSGLDPLVLYETNGQTGKYIALSHCWGTEQVMSTTTANIGRMTQGIALLSLPQTFQDAIRCARRLGIEYLWIDSLCIIQDDKIDWEIQSSRMAAVYANAYFVLVAGSADGDTRGFLHERPRIYRGIPLESSEGSGVYEIELKHIMPHPIEGGNVVRSTMLDSAVESRAWIMQETVLARRAVHFYESEMIWECNSTLTCECTEASQQWGSKNVRQASVWDGPSRRSTKMTISEESDVASDYPNFQALRIGFGFFDQSSLFQYASRPLSHLSSAEFAYAEWRLMIVPAYSRRSLTKISDRLPALSGLAAHINNYLKDEYIAGIWRRDMHLSLLWYVRSGQRLAPATYIGPSFSWTSVDTAVEYSSPHRRNEFGGPIYGRLVVEILDTGTSVSGANPFGVVDDGHLRLKGLTQSLTLVIDDGNSTLKAAFPYHRLVWHADTLLMAVQLQSVSNQPAISVNRSSARPKPPQKCEVNVVCLLVIDAPHVEGTKMDRHYDEYALLVLGQSMSRPETYQRLGLAFISFDPTDTKNWLDDAKTHELFIV